jgi:nucleoside-diphosphate-sugar epimerase
MASTEVPVYHLGTSDEITIKDAAIKILKLMGQPTEDLKVLDAPEGSVARRCPDISKAKRELGWTPHVSFESGILNYLERNNFSKN